MTAAFHTPTTDTEMSINHPAVSSNVAYLIDVSSLSGLGIYDGWGAAVLKSGLIFNRFRGEGSVRERRVDEEVIAPYVNANEVGVEDDQ